MSRSCSDPAEPAPRRGNGVLPGRRYGHAVVQGASGGLGLAIATELLERGRADRVYATSRDPDRSRGLAGLRERFGDAVRLVQIDWTDPAGIERAAARVKGEVDRIHLLVNAGGLLHAPDGLGPEKRLEQVDADALRRVFEVNAFGPLLMARWFWPLLAHEEVSVLANVSARVGSIEDNQLGGWYAYRASKAAQNMFTRTLSIELLRRAPRCICVALHPGTVDTELSRPFQRNVPPEKLFSPESAATRLLDVIDGLGARDSGGFFGWDGRRIPW